MAVVADGEVALPPACNIIQFAGDLRSPSLRWLHDQRTLAPISFQLVFAPKLLVSFEKAGSGKKKFGRTFCDSQEPFGRTQRTPIACLAGEISQDPGRRSRKRTK